MRLKRLQMQGFKSFADKTLVEFTHQIVGVVGPNGCGKSNIVDAIRWVMGEQSAKGLRGKEMTDVIFAGTPSRKAAGFAEVSLLFDNDLKQAPAPFTEVAEIMITRRLFRTGESEYLINNVKSRLKDINDLFLGTGSSAKAYSIVAQGKVDEVVLAKPEDRRSLIEEAAGIAKYKVRKLSAERKMESTQLNLDRVQDILKELERNARSLEKQVERAEKFREIQKELREIDERVVAAKVLKIDQMATANQDQLSRLREVHQAVVADLQSLEAKIEKIRFESLNHEKLTNSDYESLMKAKDQLAEAERESQLGLQKISLLKNQKEERERDIVRLAEKSKDKESLRQQLNSELAGLEAEEKTKVEKLALLKADVQEAETRVLSLQNQIAQNRQSLADFKEKTAKEVQKLEMLKAGRVDLEMKRAGSERALKEKTSEIQDVDFDLSNFEKNISEVQKDLEVRRGELQQVERKRQEARDQIAAKKDLRFELENQKTKTLSSIENLEKLEELQVGYDQGALRFRNESGQVFLMDELSFKEDYRGLGEILLHHIGQFFALNADDFETKKTQEWSGRWTFFGLLESREIGSQSVADLLEASAPEHLRKLLSQIAFVPSIDKAVSVAQLDHSGNWFMPISNQLFIQSQGPIAKAELPFSRQNEIAACQNELAQLLSRIEVTTRESAVLDGVFAELTEQEKQQKTQIESIEAELILHRDSLGVLREKRARLEAQRESIRAEILSLDQKISYLLQEIQSISIAETPETLNDEWELLKSNLETAKTHFEATESTWIEFRIETGAFKEKMDRIRQQCVDLDMTQSEYQHNQGVFQEDIRSWSDEMNRLSERSLSLVEEMKLLREKSSGLELSLAKSKEALSRLHSELETCESSRKEKQSQKEESTERLQALELERQDLKFQVEELAQIVMERYQIEIKEVVELYAAQAQDLLADPEELSNLEEKAKYLRDRLNKFGDVNLVALKEYEDVKQRLEFMNTQREDLLKTLDTLQSIIDRINQVTEFRFRETFKAINHNFQLLFPKLFGGGKAYMKLTDEADLLNTGVEIYAEPPGKKVQNMSLLSGGEKAMTSISLIFSLFAYRPSSFCILDEVDAPLDDINTRRYNDIIREMSSLSQFIVITHNKRTMEITETLFGVTMQDPGCSRIVGVDLQEARAFTGTEVEENSAEIA